VKVPVVKVPQGVVEAVVDVMAATTVDMATVVVGVMAAITADTMLIGAIPSLASTATVGFASCKFPALFKGRSYRNQLVNLRIKAVNS
jgi:hypothetical protein